MKNNSALLPPALVLFLGVFFAFFLHKTYVPPQDTFQPVFDKISKTRKIDCAYFVWPPYINKDPNTGILSGLNVDQMNEIGKALQVEVNWTLEVGLDQVAPTLNTGKADMLCASLWASSNRSWELDFSNPTHYTPLYAVVRSDDDRFDSDIDKINDASITVVFIDGDSPQAIANTKFPKAKQLALPNSSDGTINLLSLTSGKADVTFIDKYIVDVFEKNNPGKIKIVPGVDPVQIFGETFAVSKGETKFRDVMNTVIFELQNNGVMDSMLRKYKHDYRFSIHALE